MSVNLSLGARADERFHLLSKPWPTMEVWGWWDWLFRRVTWRGLTDADGFPAAFSTYILLWCIRWYWGTAKVDGSRTKVYWEGQLSSDGAQGSPDCLVVATTPKEGFSVRLRWRRPDRERWDNMGGV